MTTVLLGCLAVFGTGAAAVAGALLIQRTVPARVRYDFGMYGALTTALVVSAFLLSAVATGLFVWEAVNRANTGVVQEADALLDLYWYTRTIEGPEAVRLRSDLRDYTNHVIQVEWPTMDEMGTLNPRSWQLARQLRLDVLSISPKGGGAAIRYQDALRAVNSVFDARRSRGALITTRIPPLMWLALLSTGLLVVVLPMLRGDPRPAVRVVLAVVGAATVAFVVFLLYEVNVPFTGNVKVTPAPLEEALRSFADIDAFPGNRP
ncbi:hypothetical protein Acsp04_04170 [Actinomadura sp. NBRC 104425]|uniref:bestrophin-like domain n=1 Tax=Actinomadura sp. NBRC 104425 TaxID=3032204 RepID=UPI0024A603AD|nr:DUF4239 domain-containing protein [Actinomadura sp. NBRC 104425]GLZ10182.1 hypothetical protein Acsp04_04170 [Actinomadura sp. NBRC 104425]